jgi:hypothetical protein
MSTLAEQGQQLLDTAPVEDIMPVTPQARQEADVWLASAGQAGQRWQAATAPQSNLKERGELQVGNGSLLVSQLEAW